MTVKHSTPTAQTGQTAAVIDELESLQLIDNTIQEAAEVMKSIDAACKYLSDLQAENEAMRHMLQELANDLLRLADAFSDNLPNYATAFRTMAEAARTTIR